ncbi:MAG: hypothetical protein QUT30_21900 [Acidobacteriota bacterium]|nr:hypothetical protein [Acidobacteriota bacterium]
MDTYIKSLRFGGGAEQTVVTPLAIMLMAIVLVLIMAVQRKHLFIPILFGTVFIPLEQQIVVFGVHLMVFRLVILFGWVRVLSSGFATGLTATKMDKFILWWGITASVTFVLLWGEVNAIINRFGFLYNAFGFYFLFRVLVCDKDDAIRLLKAFAATCTILAPVMAIEVLYGRNMFSVFGLPEFTAIRDGKIRAQGPFAHSILAGTFGAGLLPMFIGIWWSDRRSRIWAAFGVVSAAVIVLTSASATPLLSGFLGILGIAFWYQRERMSAIRWAIVLVTVALQLVMKANVWALIGRIRISGGSSYHRYELINQFILRFAEWWLIGTRNVAEWGYLMYDTVNQYVSTGTQGGLISLVLFIAIIVIGFKMVGRARRAALSDISLQKQVWCTGAALFGYCTSFIGVSLFDQSIVAWYALLAIIVALFNTASSLQADPEFSDETMNTVALKPQLLTAGSQIFKNIPHGRHFRNYR